MNHFIVTSFAALTARFLRWAVLRSAVTQSLPVFHRRMPRARAQGPGYAENRWICRILLVASSAATL